MRRREEQGGEDVKWSEPELSHKVRVEKKSSAVEQMLSVGGLVIAMDVAAAVAERWRR